MPITDPSENCRAGGAADDIPGATKCYGGDGTTDPDPQLKRPGEALGPNARGNRLRGLDVSQGFNFGLLLLPYILDHGDKLGIMTRKKAYITILHSWARHNDRRYALTCVPAFVSKTDRGHAPFLDFLCSIPPFVGYRWDAPSMERWQKHAVAKASAYGARDSLDATAAAAAAIAWCAETRGFFEQLSVERFPYSPPDVVSYWLNDGTAAAVPAPDSPPA